MGYGWKSFVKLIPPYPMVTQETGMTIKSGHFICHLGKGVIIQKKKGSETNKGNI